MTTRRSFIRNSILLALVAPLSNAFTVLPKRKLSAFGIQLYMVKEDMEKDPLGTLKKLGQMGYTYIESYGGPKGVFWGMENKQFKQTAAGLGLNLVSTHYNEDDLPFEKLAEQSAEIGMKYLICPWKGPQKSIDDFKRIADDFNRHGEICKRHGLRYAYHPHDYPYKKVDGQLPIDVLLQHTDKGLVDFQMDFYYTASEGFSPEAYLTRYKNRFRLCHMRDVLKKPLPKGSKDESACDLGQGRLNYPHLLTVAMNNGVDYFFVEQSRFYNETPMQSAAINAAYLKRIQLT
ncbi:sugar phosphate isomerase/epimerase family protein [Mucilaginibacter sp.]